MMERHEILFYLNDQDLEEVNYNPYIVFHISKDYNSLM